MADPTVRFTNNGDWILPNNQKFQAGDFLLSQDGRFKLTMNEDSQLVLLDNGAHIWTADKQQPFSLALKRPNEKGPAFFYISNSGFLYDPRRESMWVAEASHSKDKSRWSNTHMALQPDGNLVIQDMRRVWPKTNYPFQPSLLAPIPIPEAELLRVGHQYSTGDHYLILQADGNLAIYTAANELTWQSGTVVEGGTKASFQSDGRFVIANHADVVLWQTDTAGKVDAWPYIQPDGQLMLMNVFPVWARFGFTPGRSHRRKFYPAPWRDIPTHNLNGYQYQVIEW